MNPSSADDAALTVDPLEIADHMHAEIATRRQRGRAHSRRVERLAGLLNEYVEAGLAQELLQAIVKHVARERGISAHVTTSSP